MTSYQALGEKLEMGDQITVTEKEITMFGIIKRMPGTIERWYEVVNQHDLSSEEEELSVNICQAKREI